MASSIVVRGSGSIGVRHARVFASLGHRVQLWPVRPRQESPTEAATLVGDAQAQDALAQADLVVIATDTGRHVADTLQALEAGAPRILLEKPVAPSHADAQRLAPMADRIWVAAPLRAHESFRCLARLLPELGGDLAAHVWSQSWLPDWRPDRDYRSSYSADPEQGGVLRDLVHELDYLTVLFGTPSLVGAVLDHSGPLEIRAEQSASLLVRTPLARAVSVQLDYITRPTTRGVTITGPRGSLHWSATEHQVTRLTPDGAPEVLTFAADSDRDATMAVQARAALELAPDAAPSTLIEAGAPATLQQGLATLQLCDAARLFVQASVHPGPEGES